MMNPRPPDHNYWRSVTAIVIIVILAAIVFFHLDWFSGIESITNHAFLIFLMGVAGAVSQWLLWSRPTPLYRDQRAMYQEVPYGYPSPYYGSPAQRSGCWLALILLVLFLVVVGCMWPFLSHFLPPLSQLVPQAPAPSIVHPVMRLDQNDPRQYASAQEYHLWSPSTCSAAAMTEVLDAYGKTLRITDVLQAERAVHAITVAQGLLDEDGIARTVSAFGFHAVLSHAKSLDWVIATANAGHPVIASFPPQTWNGGHLLVVTGGDAATVNVADSSTYNYTSFPRAKFLTYWRGFTALVTP